MHKQTIALIDDDRNILTSISIALEKEGFNSSNIFRWRKRINWTYKIATRFSSY